MGTVDTVTQMSSVLGVASLSKNECGTEVSEVRNTKNLVISTIPDVKLINDKQLSLAGPSNGESQCKLYARQSDKLFTMFYSNITSLSSHAQQYLFDLPDEVSALLLVEVHKDQEYVKSKFKRNCFNVSYSPPEATSDTGNHGGELVATRHNFISTGVDQTILDLMDSKFEKRRFAARIISFQSVNVLVIAVYLWCSEGFSERNQSILNQILILKKLLKLPFICFGDFNITFEEFQQSEWPTTFRARMIHPKVKSTISTHSERAIDFGLISNEIYLMFHDIKPIHSVVWGPHIGLLITVYAQIRSIFTNVQCLPKALPLPEFNKIWKTMSPQQQLLAFTKAKNLPK